MEGKRKSFSLQDLRSVSAPLDLEACTEESLLEQQRAWNFPSRGLSKGQVQGSRRAGCKLATCVLVAVLVVSLFCLGFVWGRSIWAQEEQMHFAIVMDCGSTSTRVYVYGWVHNGGSMPVMYRPPSHNDPGQIADKSKQKAYHRMETEPGFHHLVHNETGLKRAVQPLLDWAKQQIPSRSHAETPLFLLGTAGLRKLPPADSEWLLDKTWSVVEKSPFKCRRSWLRIISGVEEAYYGWVALNYVLERLGHGIKFPTVGSLDLGGSSLEVTFEPDEAIRTGYGVNLSIAREQHQLYAYSHPGFGLNDAFDKSVSLLMSKGGGGNLTAKDDMLELRHPCLHSEYRQPYACSSYCAVPPAGDRDKGAAAQLVLIGDPNWDQCKALAHAVVNSSRLSRSSDCEQPDSCALGRYQPEPNGQFSAVAGFFVMYKFFGLSSKASLDDLLQRGRKFCETPWPAAKASVKPQDYIDRYCFRAPYVVSLLRDGLHLKDEQITVGPGDITWTQGAALLESGVLGWRRSQKESWLGSPSSVPGLLNAPAVTALVVVLLLLLLLAFSFLHRHRSFSSSSPYEPRPSPVLGASRWLPPIITRGLRPGDAARTKAPHSPAPSSTARYGFHELQQSRMVHIEANVPLLIEADMLRLPPPVPGGARHHSSKVQKHNKGGSRLQSRRTPSKEDLNTL